MKKIIITLFLPLFALSASGITEFMTVDRDDRKMFYKTVKESHSLDDEGHDDYGIDCWGLGTTTFKYKVYPEANGSTVYNPTEPINSGNNRNFILEYVLNEVDVIHNYQGTFVLPTGESLQWVSTQDGKHIQINLV
jgi:hypothetical protein